MDDETLTIITYLRTPINQEETISDLIRQSIDKNDFTELDDKTNELVEKCDFPIYPIDFVKEDLMPVCYSAADLFIIASLEDNLPNTVIESMACEVPVVGFNVGGTHKWNTDLIGIDGNPIVLPAVGETKHIVIDARSMRKGQNGPSRYAENLIIN